MINQMMMRKFFRQLATSSLGFEGSSGSFDLRKKLFLITGSTDGIGLQTATLLAAKGATVLLHGRSLSKVKKVLKNIRNHTSNPRVFAYNYDLSSFAQTRLFGQHILHDLDTFFQGQKITCLVNNAGVFLEDKHITEDGLEMTWQVNTAAPFLLTSLLLPSIEERIINCSSISLADTIDLSKIQHQTNNNNNNINTTTATISVDDNDNNNSYERMGHAAYGVSKLALNIWSYRLAELLQQNGSTVTVNCVDPGTVSTKLLYAGWGDISYVALKVDEADDEFWGAVDPLLATVTGKYYVNRKSTQSPTVSYNKELQLQLWRILEQQTGAVMPLVDNSSSSSGGGSSE